jgi:hypothetical protein
MRWLVTLLAVPVALLAACGGSSHQAATNPLSVPTTSTAPSIVHGRPYQPPAHETPLLRRQKHRLDLDLRRIHRVTWPVKTHTLMGTPAVQSATSDFIDHIDRSALDDLTFNHYLTLAAAMVAPVCDQCFQWLEADRPAAGGAKMP